MSTISALYAKTLADLAQLDRDRDRLLIVKATLESLGAAPAAAHPAKPIPIGKVAAKARQRAPKGALATALKTVMAGASTALTIPEIKRDLKANGYTYPVSTNLVRKALKAMVKANFLSSSYTGGGLSCFELLKSA